MCLLVCLLFIGHTTFVHFAALPPSVRESRSRRGRPRARGGQACTCESTRACIPYNFSTKKSLRWCLSKRKPYARAHAVVYVTDEIFKKREKENQHATSQVQFTACLLLECLLFESYWIVFFTNRVCWPPWNHGEPGDLPSLRRRGESEEESKTAGDMQKGEHGKDGSRHRPGGMWIACGLPKPVPRRRLKRRRQGGMWSACGLTCTRSTKATIMTVHVNTIMQAAPSQRRIILICEASNQLLSHYQKFFTEWIWWRINIFLKSYSRPKKLQPGGKPNSFAFRNPGRPRRSINCSRDGSRTASRFAIQVRVRPRRSK